LLQNAIKFTNARGRVRIVAALQSTDGGSLELGLTVTDSGIGIPRDQLPRVFELFMQGDDAKKKSESGLGIGLALARRLVELHGGSIEAHSEGPGRGSVFTVRLPVPALASAPATDERGTNALEIHRRVVVIDDNADAANAMALLVAALGGESNVAYDGESGLTQVISARPDLVLLDIGMPGIDGYETCRRIRKALGSDVIVVAMTGWGQDQDKEEARRAGFDAHLTKPVDPATLERVLAASGSAR
jgi:CheY-like chemotaxis protein